MFVFTGNNAYRNIHARARARITVVTGQVLRHNVRETNVLAVTLGNVCMSVVN